MKLEISLSEPDREILKDLIRVLVDYRLDKRNNKSTFPLPSSTPSASGSITDEARVGEVYKGSGVWGRFLENEEGNQPGG